MSKISPKLGFGLMRLPEKEGVIDIDAVRTMIDRFMQSGFNYFDTAYVYHGGRSEVVVRDALVGRYPRESYTIATKLPAWALKCEEDRDRILNEQLERAGVDYFDYYLLHSLEDGGNYDTYEKFDCFNWLLEKKRQGLVKHAGFSFHDNPELLDEILTKHPEMEFVQLQINYLDWESEWVHSKGVYEVATRHGKPVIVMEPVKGGTLAKVPPQAEKLLNDLDPNMSIPSWAIRFAASLENVMVVLSGMSSVEQMRDNISFMKNFQPLTKEETEATRKVADLINGQIAVPCTACSYCTEGCPMHIAIPKYFSLYNEDMREDMAHKGWTINFTNYDKLTEHFGRAADCIGCGQCESVCPQHLPIIEKLREVSAHFDH